ncbi:MAG: TorD/DmsD family molecular chaperone [Anaerolineae bacterium]
MTGNGHWAVTEEGQYWLAALRGLARGFTYPDAAWVETLLDGRWLEVLASVVSAQGLSVLGLRQAVETLPNDTPTALRILEVEYTYLFINAVPRVPAPPYASAYTKQGLLMGEPAEAALVAYRQAGLSLAEDYRDLPDHVAAELEFLASLGRQAVEALEVGERELARVRLAQLQAFVEQQAWPWLPGFCQRVVKAARTPFYRELARLALALLSAAPMPQHADSLGGN